MTLFYCAGVLHAFSQNGVQGGFAIKMRSAI
jgi:hypothetical protein